jgi:hypothetical protein
VSVKTGVHGSPGVGASTQAMHAHHRRTRAAFFHSDMVHQVKTHPIAFRQAKFFFGILQTPKAKL